MNDDTDTIKKNRDVDENGFIICLNGESNDLIDCIKYEGVEAFMLYSFGKTEKELDDNINYLIDFYDKLGGKLVWYHWWKSPIASQSGFLVIDKETHSIVLRKRQIWIS